MELYAREAKKKFKRIERVKFLAFDDGFLARLEPLVRHLNTIKSAFDGNALELTWNGTLFVSNVYRLSL